MDEYLEMEYEDRSYLADDDLAEYNQNEMLDYLNEGWED